MIYTFKCFNIINKIKEHFKIFSEINFTGFLLAHVRYNSTKESLRRDFFSSPIQKWGASLKLRIRGSSILVKIHLPVSHRRKVK